MRRRLFIERGAWWLGLVLLGVFATAELHGRYLQQRDLTRFHQVREAFSAATGKPMTAISSAEIMYLLCMMLSPPQVWSARFSVDEFRVSHSAAFITA